MAQTYIVVTQVKSAIGRLQSHKDCLRGLGLRKIRQSVRVPATPEVLGMVKTIEYMVRVEKE